MTDQHTTKEPEREAFGVTNELMTEAWGRNADGRARWSGEDLHAVKKIIKAYESWQAARHPKPVDVQDVERVAESILETMGETEGFGDRQRSKLLAEAALHALSHPPQSENALIEIMGKAAFCKREISDHDFGMMRAAYRALVNAGAIKGGNGGKA